MLGPGGKHQQGFCFHMHVLMQQQLTQLFAQRGAPWLTRSYDFTPGCRQQVQHSGDMRAFARPVHAFQSDKQTCHYLLSHIIVLELIQCFFN
jgi:hypothetical protein